MRTVQMTLDEDLIRAMDEMARRMGTSRSGLVRTAVRDALDRWRARELEERHRKGYERHPVRPGEFDMDESRLSWGDE